MRRWKQPSVYCGGCFEKPCLHLSLYLFLQWLLILYSHPLNNEIVTLYHQMLSVDPCTPALFLLLQLAPLLSLRGGTITQPRLYLGPPMFERPSYLMHHSKVNPASPSEGRAAAKKKREKKEAGAWQKKQRVEQSAGATQSAEHPEVIMLRFIIKHHKPAALVIISAQFTDITSHHFWVMRMKIWKQLSPDVAAAAAAAKSRLFVCN